MLTNPDGPHEIFKTQLPNIKVIYVTAINTTACDTICLAILVH